MISKTINKKVFKKDKSFVFVSLKDSGTGIDEEIKDKLFEPYFTTKKKGRGTGLGLPIVKKILDSLDANLEIRSPEGQGCEFKMLFPALEEDKKTLRAAKVILNKQKGKNYG